MSPLINLDSVNPNFSLRLESRDLSKSQDGKNGGEEISWKLGSEKIDTIEAYSVKISGLCWDWGTAWFLDHEIPKGDKKYPTKWFLATGAHVINNYKLRDTGTYTSKVPKKFNDKPCLGKDQEYTNIFLFKESKSDQALDGRSAEFDFSRGRDSWVDYSSQFQSWETVSPKSAHPVRNERNKSNFWYYRTENAKLFYVATDFFHQNNWFDRNKHYHKDFAVLEIDFPDEITAKRITDDLYGKISSGKIKQLNFMNDGLSDARTTEELHFRNNSLFIAGYPSNSQTQFKLAGNYSFDQKRAGRIYGDGFRDVRNDPITSWNGESLYRFGRNYMVDGSPLEAGASGSLTINSNGDVVGLLSMGFRNTDISLIEPIRSTGIYNGKKVHPSYDLILGTLEQRDSYRSQLNKCYPNLDTNLRRKWNALRKPTSKISVPLQRRLTSIRQKRLSWR